MKKCNCKKTKNRYRCLECDNEQTPGSYCQNCCGTEMVSIGPGVPGAGIIIESCRMLLVSLGEIDKRGRLRVALPESSSEYWGCVHEWTVVDDEPIPYSLAGGNT